MFLWKADRIFKDLPNVVGTVDDIFIIHYDVDSRDHDRTLRWVMQIFHQENLTKNKCYFRCLRVPFFSKMVSRCGVQPDTLKLHIFTYILSPNSKKQFQSFLGIINYLGKFLPSTAEVCEPLRKLTSKKTRCMWTNIPKLYKRAKSIIENNASMKFYNEQSSYT